MTSPTDGNAQDLSRNLIQALDDLSGVHPGFRPAHAKGIMLTGTFKPSPAASSVTRAPHAQREATPVTVRFSDSTGVPTIADNDPKNASPRGIAIRFHLGPHVHTDIIGHSHDGFPSRTPEEFLEFLRAAHASGPGAPSPSPIESFLAAHPKAMEFIAAPKPIPTSFAKDSYFTVTAFQFINKEGVARFGRFRIRPEDGGEYLDEAGAAAKSANFLLDDIAERIAKGPVRMNVLVQLAESGDTVDDATAHWPEQRANAEFGTIELTAVIAEDDTEARRLIFDPIPRVDGIEPSADPLLEARAAVYLMSGRRRRGAAEAAGV